MNKRQENKLTMYEGLLTLLQANSAAFQSIGGNQHTLGPLEVRDDFSELVRLKRSVREEIEIDRAPVPKPQRQRRPTIEREMIGRCIELPPQAELRRRKDARVGRKNHANSSLIRCETII